MQDYLSHFDKFPMVIYLGAFILGLLMLFLNSLGVFGDGDIDVEVDTDVDIDADVDADTSGPSVLEGDVDTNDPGYAWKFMSFFGLGKVPMGIWIFTYLITFAIAGFIANMILHGISSTLMYGFFIEVLLGVSSMAMFVTKFVSQLFARLMPKTVSYNLESMHELEGKIAILEFTLKKGKSSFAHVHDQHDTRHQVKVILSEKETIDSIASRKQIYLSNYDEENNTFDASPFE